MPRRNRKTTIANPMKKLLLVTAVAIAFAFAAAPNSSAQSGVFTFTPLTSLNVAPGGSVQFQIFLNYTAGGNIPTIGGLTYFLQQTSPSSPFVFSITGNFSGPPNFTGQRGRDWVNGPGGSSIFDDVLTSDQSFNNAPLNAGATTATPGSNALDLGALVDQTNFPNGAPSGNYFIANITLTLAGNAPAGNYTIQQTTTGGKQSVINDQTGSFTAPITGGTITFTVIPEPSTYALLAFGGVSIAVLAFRRRRSLA